MAKTDQELKPVLDAVLDALLKATAPKRPGPLLEWPWN